MGKCSSIPGCLLLQEVPGGSDVIGATQDRERYVGLALQVRSRQEGVAARPQMHHQETAQLVQVTWKYIVKMPHLSNLFNFSHPMMV